MWHGKRELYKSNPLVHDVHMRYSSVSPFDFGAQHVSTHDVKRVFDPGLEFCFLILILSSLKGPVVSK